MQAHSTPDTPCDAYLSICASYIYIVTRDTGPSSCYCVLEIMPLCTRVYSVLVACCLVLCLCCLRVENGHRILPVLVLLVHATKLWFLLSPRQLRDYYATGEGCSTSSCQCRAVRRACALPRRVAQSVASRDVEGWDCVRCACGCGTCAWGCASASEVNAICHGFGVVGSSGYESERRDHEVCCPVCVLGSGMRHVSRAERRELVSVSRVVPHGLRRAVPAHLHLLAGCPCLCVHWHS